MIVIAVVSGEMKMICKIKKNLSRGPRNPFYINVACFHLKRPRLKIRQKSTVEGYPIIHVDTGKAQ